MIANYCLRFNFELQNTLRINRNHAPPRPLCPPTAPTPRPPLRGRATPRREGRDPPRPRVLFADPNCCPQYIPAWGVVSSNFPRNRAQLAQQCASDRSQRRESPFRGAPHPGTGQSPETTKATHPFEPPQEEEISESKVTFALFFPLFDLKFRIDHGFGVALDQ